VLHRRTKARSTAQNKNQKQENHPGEMRFGYQYLYTLFMSSRECERETRENKQNTAASKPSKSFGRKEKRSSSSRQPKPNKLKRSGKPASIVKTRAKQKITTETDREKIMKMKEKKLLH